MEMRFCTLAPRGPSHLSSEPAKRLIFSPTIRQRASGTRVGLVILVEKGSEIRDCNFEWDMGIGDFTILGSNTFFLGKWVENVQRESSCNLRECGK